MASRDRKPVDIVLDAALRHTLHGLGFQSRSKNARYFKLPRDGFEWFVAFGPGPYGIEREAFTEATCIYIPEVAKMQKALGGDWADKPTRIRYPAHYFGSIAKFADEARAEMRSEYEAGSLWWRLQDRAADLEILHERNGDRILWAFYYFWAGFLYLFGPLPSQVAPGWFERQVSCYRGGNEFKGGGYWNTRDQDLVGMGLLLDQCWWDHCLPVVADFQDLGSVADAFFPIGTHSFGAGVDLSVAMVQMAAGNTVGVRETLEAAVREGQTDWEGFLGKYRTQVGEREFRAALDSPESLEFLHRQWRTCARKAGEARKIADVLGVALPQSSI